MQSWKPKENQKIIVEKICKTRIWIANSRINTYKCPLLNKKSKWPKLTLYNSGETKFPRDSDWHLMSTSTPKKRGFISPECHRSKIGETSLFQYLNQPKRVLWDWSRMHPNQMTLSKQNTPWKSIKKKPRTQTKLQNRFKARKILHRCKCNGRQKD